MLDVRAQTIKLIAEVLRIDESSVTLSQNFKDDLGADSLDMVEIMLALEQEYRLNIPEYEEEHLKTVSGLIGYTELLASRAAA